MTSSMGTTTTGTNHSSGKADAAKGAASEVAGEATSAASDVKENVKTEVGSVVSDATDRAGSVLRASQHELRSQAESKAHDLSSTLSSTAQQLRSMAQGADDPGSAVAQLSRSAADQLERQSRRLEDGGLEGLVDDARRFARNRPGAFMLGTVAAGFAVGRLAKHANLKQAADSAKQELTGGDSPAGSSSTATTGGPRPATPPPAPTTMPVDPGATSTGSTGGAGGRL